jgi:muramoyltetrapeptide carboxypeptidase
MTNIGKPLQGLGFTPPFLKKGSVIGITCPSSYVAPEKIDSCVSVLEHWGFKVKRGSTIGTNHHYFSGTDDERRADLQAMLDDPGIDAILMGRGGYGMSRIIDGLDFTAFVKQPKWVCGFSDITVLHNHIEKNFGIATLHSPMCGAFTTETANEAYLKTFYAALAGESIFYHTHAHRYNRNGVTEASLIGGNLSLLSHVVGSASDVDTAGKILFIEDIEEYLYKMDRMLLTLKRAGKLDHLKGLVVGYMTNMLDTDRPFGQNIEEIIWDKVKEYHYPVCFNFPCGHEDINYTLTMGAAHKLAVTDNGAILELKRIL